MTQTNPSPCGGPVFNSLLCCCSRGETPLDLYCLSTREILELCLLEKSRGEGSFGLACCLDGVAGTRGDGLTGRGGACHRNLVAHWFDLE